MASILKPKCRTADATAPTTANLADGEVAINHVSKTIYQRIGAAVVAVANYFTDAPSDGTTYGRKDGAWVAAGETKVYGSTFTASFTLTSANLNKLIEFTGSGSGVYVYIPTGLGAHADIINVVNSTPYSYTLTVTPLSGVTLYKGGTSVASVAISPKALITLVRLNASNTWMAM